MSLHNLKDVDTYIREHTDKDYCEAVITKDGLVTDAVPSHMYCIIALTGRDKDYLDSKMPMFSAPLEWLISYSGVVSVWYNSFIYHTLSDEQKKTLLKLQQSGVLARYIIGSYTNEYKHCRELSDFYDGKVDIVPSSVRKVCILDREVGDFVEYIQ